MNFFYYGFVPFLSEDSFLLLDGREGWRDVELVNHNTWINSWHILIAQSKSVQVVLQEKGELPANQRVGLGVDASHLV